MRTCFSEEYGGILGKCARVREAGAPPEAALQRFWAEGVLVGEALVTHGHPRQAVAEMVAAANHPALPQRRTQ